MRGSAAFPPARVWGMFHRRRWRADRSGKLRDGDVIEIVIDRNKLEGHVNFVGENGENVRCRRRPPATAEARGRATDLRPDPALPADTRLWAALQHASGGIWGGCVYDAEAIVRKLRG